jgi:hypothetical protein
MSIFTHTLESLLGDVFFIMISFMQSWNVHKRIRFSLVWGPSWKVYGTLLFAFAYLVLGPIGGLCTTLLFTFVFATTDGVVDSNNPFYMHDVKFG